MTLNRTSNIVARAALKLGITQSGVSNAMSRLEDRLGVRLLAGTTRRVNLTVDGAAFLDRCRRILADLVMYPARSPETFVPKLANRGRTPP